MGQPLVAVGCATLKPQDMGQAFSFHNLRCFSYREAAEGTKKIRRQRGQGWSKRSWGLGQHVKCCPPKNWWYASLLLPGLGKEGGRVEEELRRLWPTISSPVFLSSTLYQWREEEQEHWRWAGVCILPVWCLKEPFQLDSVRWAGPGRGPEETKGRRKM